MIENEFSIFAKELAQLISGMTRDNKGRVNRLSALELEWRDELLKHARGPGSYKAFIHYLRDEMRNIRAARPFFRERQEGFSAKVSKPMEAGDWEALAKAHPNYLFVRFVMTRGRWGKKSKVKVLADQLTKVRDELIKTNLPLVISRSRIFWSRTHESHLEFRDLIQISADGLMAGIDKFGGEWSPTWGSTVVGRMHGNLIDAFSDTMMHLYSIDKKRLYRANKAMGRTGELDMDEVMREVNADSDEPATPSQIAELLAAVAWHSTDHPVSKVEGAGIDESAQDGGGPEPQYEDESKRPDKIAEEREGMAMVSKAVRGLNIYEKKLLTLNGIGGLL